MLHHFLILPGKKNFIGMVDLNLYTLRPLNRSSPIMKWRKIFSRSFSDLEATHSTDRCSKLLLEFLFQQRTRSLGRWHSLPVPLFRLVLNMISTKKGRQHSQHPSKAVTSFTRLNVRLVILNPCSPIIVIGIMACPLIRN